MYTDSRAGIEVISLRWRIINEDEAERYDSFLASLESGDILQSFDWGKVKSEWRPVRGVVENESGKIMACASILLRPLPLMGKTVAYAPRGPALPDYNDRELLAFILSAMIEESRRNKAILLKIDPPVTDDKTGTKELLKEMGFIHNNSSGNFGGMQPRYTFRLPLDGTLEEIFARFPKKVRYKINYGPQRGLVFKADEETSIDDLFAVLAKTGSRRDFLVRSPDYFRQMYSILKKENRILLLTGYLAGEPVVSSLTLVFGQNAWAVYGGQDDRHRNIYAYHAMNWERIRWAHAHGARWFDFYGVPGEVDESHPLYGLYHFKKSFGGQFTAYIGEWDRPISLPYYQLWEHALPAYRRLAKKLVKRFRK